VNTILNSGEVPNLFEKDELEQVLGAIRPIAKNFGIPEGLIYTIPEGFGIPEGLIYTIPEGFGIPEGLIYTTCMGKIRDRMTKCVKTWHGKDFQGNGLLCLHWKKQVGLKRIMYICNAS